MISFCKNDQKKNSKATFSRNKILNSGTVFNNEPFSNKICVYPIGSKVNITEEKKPGVHRIKLLLNIPHDQL